MGLTAAGSRIAIDLAVAMTPRYCRATRREQWLADLRDAHELGMPDSAVALGALLNSLRGAPAPSAAQLDAVGVGSVRIDAASKIVLLAAALALTAVYGVVSQPESSPTVVSLPQPTYFGDEPWDFASAEQLAGCSTGAMMARLEVAAGDPDARLERPTEMDLEDPRMQSVVATWYQMPDAERLFQLCLM